MDPTWTLRSSDLQRERVRRQQHAMTTLRIHTPLETTAVSYDHLAVAADKVKPHEVEIIRARLGDDEPGGSELRRQS